MTSTFEGVNVQLPFPGATGRGLKIAVIDSGVNVRHPHIFARTSGVTLAPELGQSWQDSVGHGTAVMAAIQEKAPDAEYYAVKVFGNSLRTTSLRLMEAMEWAILNRMDVVNLSLGTPNLDYRHELQALVAKGASAGVLFVSAWRAGDHPVLPGALEGVLPVEVDWDLPRDRYRIEYTGGCPRCFASGYPRSLPGLSQARNLNGISFATANITGFAVRACEGVRDRSFEAVHQALASENARMQRISILR